MPKTEYKKRHVQKETVHGKKRSKEKNTLSMIQKKFFRTQMILIISLSVFLGIANMGVNVYFEQQKRDRNLQNIADTISGFPTLKETIVETDRKLPLSLLNYLNSLETTLDDVDVVSIVNKDNRRLYHSNNDLIGTIYDGEKPEFEQNDGSFYLVNAKGPSGSQRRAYAAIYDENGNYAGFLMVIMLMKNIYQEILSVFGISLLLMCIAISLELGLCVKLSGIIKNSLMGYEPDVFTAMYQVRDNILESLNEGVIAIDDKGTIQFANRAAKRMILQEGNPKKAFVGQALKEMDSGKKLLHILEGKEKEFNIHERNLGSIDMLIDRIPIQEEKERVGTIGILHDRTEYTKLMEDLSGTRYLVDSMRANNHEFTNKLHVILGLIQMEMYGEAAAYIENITMVERSTISKIMRMVDTPALAALLIGKTARASELNIKFVFREGSFYSGSDLSLPTQMLVMVIGNLIENAFDSMNQQSKPYGQEKELLFGIYSRQGAVLITVDDTGCGMENDVLKRIFEKGYSTKGEGRGTGLYQVKNAVEGFGGRITVESQLGIGTSFSISFGEAEKGEESNHV